MKPAEPRLDGHAHHPTKNVARKAHKWNLRLRVMIYREHVAHESPKSFQLDLFTPDDGHFEYATAATNMALDLPALYAFICGRGAQEKTIAELKGTLPSMLSRPGTMGPTPRGSNSASSPTTSSQLPTRHPGGAQAPLAQTHLSVPDP